MAALQHALLPALEAELHDLVLELLRMLETKLGGVGAGADGDGDGEGRSDATTVGSGGGGAVARAVDFARVHDLPNAVEVGARAPAACATRT